MQVGDLVCHSVDKSVGIIIEMIDHIEVPPVAKVLWQDGFIDKEWTDAIKVIKNKNNT